ncbi:hypothetical protein MTO96_037204 [Rhipicephalus appendiculatus]
MLQCRTRSWHSAFFGPRSPAFQVVTTTASGYLAVRRILTHMDRMIQKVRACLAQEPSDNRSPVTILVRRKRLVFLLAAPFLCYYAVTQLRYLRMPEVVGHGCPLVNSPSNSNATNVLPRILMWTIYFGNWSETLDDTRIGEDFVGNCTAKCLITNDPCLIEYSDAVVFHMRSMNIMQLPSKRFTWQKWVFFLMESPPHTGFADFNFTHGMFNWTMTYRRDSDVYVPYGGILPRSTNATRAKRDLKTLWKLKNKTVRMDRQQLQHLRWTGTLRRRIEEVRGRRHLWLLRRPQVPRVT